MTIAVNTISFFNNSEEKNFILENFSAVAKQNPGNNFIFIFDNEKDFSLIFPGNVQPVLIAHLPKRPLLWRLWYDYKIPSLLKRYKADVLVTSQICSLGTKIPQCLLLDDLSFLEYPHFFLKSHFNFYKKNFPAFLNKSKVVITLSECTKKKLIENYKIENDKVDVVHQNEDEIFAPVNFNDKEIVKEKYAEGNEYFLFTGAITPKNNLFNLLKAFSFFKKRQKSNMQLLICGALGYRHEVITESLRLFKFKNEVKVYTGLQKKDLSKIMASSYAMVYPFYFQHFDLPVSNAMKCEVPVIISDLPRVREMCGDAALYTDPFDHKMIADKMMQLFKDEELRKLLIEKGKTQIEKYTPGETATLLWQQGILKTCS